MNTIEDLRSWAGVTGSSQDALLRQIEAGVVDLVGLYTNRLLVSPPERAVQILDGPDANTGGLSGIDAGPMQWVTLREPPIAALSGTFTVAPGETAVTGSGTKALTELSADPASAITFPGLEPILVSTITSDTSFSLSEAITDGVDGVTGEAAIISLETRSEGGLSASWRPLDLRRFEVKGRRVYSLRDEVEPGRRTVRVSYRRGFEEGEGPPAISLLVLDMVKSSYVNRRRRSSSVSVDGGFRIAWPNFKEEAEVFMARADALTRPAAY